MSSSLPPGSGDRKATIMTDEWAAYAGIGAEFKGGHHVVRHTAGEYSRHGVNVNTAESFFALMKRGVMGAFQTGSPVASPPRIFHPPNNDNGYMIGGTRSRGATDAEAPASRAWCSGEGEP